MEDMSEEFQEGKSKMESVNFNTSSQEPRRKLFRESMISEKKRSAMVDVVKMQLLFSMNGLKVSSIKLRSLLRRITK